MKVAQHFFLLCDTLTSTNSSPSSRPSGSPDDDESSAGGLLAEGEFLADGGPEDLNSSVLAVLDIFASKRQDLQLVHRYARCGANRKGILHLGCMCFEIAHVVQFLR